MTRTNTILSLSIALNIFLFGSIAGAAFWFTRAERMIMAGSLRVAGSELPADTRAEFRKSLREARQAMAEQQKEARNARVRVAELLRQPTVDAAAVAAALAQARAAEVSIRIAIEDRAAQFVSALPLKDRRMLADGMERRGKLRAVDNP